MEPPAKRPWGLWLALGVGALYALLVFGMLLYREFSTTACPRCRGTGRIEAAAEGAERETRYGDR